MSTAVEQALDRFVQASIALKETLNTPPTIEYDTEWPSPCYQGEKNSDGDICWLPVRQTQSNDLFERLELALEVPIHDDIKQYYLRYWSDPLGARSLQGQLNLLFVWNTQDFERLRANLIGHALGRIKLKQPLSLFFACTHPEEYVLAVDNDSGQVMLEQPGKRSRDLIAPSLADFISQLEPIFLTD